MRVGSPPGGCGMVGSGPRMPNPPQGMSFVGQTDFNSMRPSNAGGSEMLRKQLEQSQPMSGGTIQQIRSPMASGHGSGSNSLLMAQLEKQSQSQHNQDKSKGKGPDNIHLQGMLEPKMEIKTEDGLKREVKDEPMDFFSDDSSSFMVKKEEMKTVDAIKMEPGTSSREPDSDASSGPSTSKSEPSAASKLPMGANKVKFAPEELKKALEPPLVIIFSIKSAVIFIQIIQL